MKVFKDNKEFDEIYAACLEKCPPISKKATRLRDKAEDIFDNYLDVLDAETFRYGYECGYKAAMEKAGKGKAKDEA